MPPPEYRLHFLYLRVQVGAPCKMNFVFSASSPFENDWRIPKLHVSLLQIGFQYFTCQENVAKLGQCSNVSFS